MSEFRIDQIKSQDATRGPDVAGITTFTGTSGIVMPSGDTAYRGGITSWCNNYSLYFILIQLMMINNSQPKAGGSSKLEQI